MAIVFYGSPPSILFHNGSIAMDTACCCKLCTLPAGDPPAGMASAYTVTNLSGIGYCNFCFPAKSINPPSCDNTATWDPTSRTWKYGFFHTGVNPSATGCNINGMALAGFYISLINCVWVLTFICRKLPNGNQLVNYATWNKTTGATPSGTYSFASGCTTSTTQLVVA